MEYLTVQLEQGFFDYFESLKTPEFYAVIFFVMILIEVIKEVLSKKENLPDPNYATGSGITVCVKKVNLSELQIKIIVILSTLAGIVLYRLPGGNIVAVETIFESIMLFLLVILLYFLGGKWLAKGLVNLALSGLKKLNIIPNDETIDEDQYMKKKMDAIKARFEADEKACEDEEGFTIKG